MVETATYIAPEITFAAGLTARAWKRLLSENRFNIPPAIKGATKTQRYGLATVFEAALIQGLMSTGVNTESASALLKRRWHFMLKVRGQELLRAAPANLDVLSTDPSWHALEFVERDLDDPIYYVVKPSGTPQQPGQGTALEMYCPHASTLRDFLREDDAFGHVIVNATRIIVAVEGALKMLADAESNLRAAVAAAPPTGPDWVAAQIAAGKARATG